MVPQSSLMGHLLLSLYDIHVLVSKIIIRCIYMCVVVILEVSSEIKRFKIFSKPIGQLGLFLFRNTASLPVNSVRHVQH